MKPRIILWLLFSLSLILLTGCGPGRIDSVLRESQDGITTGSVMLLRQGVTSSAPAMTQLEQGDIIETPAGVTAVIWLEGGSRLILAPETKIQLVNPNHIIRLLTSAGDSIGELFIKARDALRIDGEYVSAANQGTEYLVTQAPDGRFTVTVVSGRVLLTSQADEFRPVRIKKLESISASPGERPLKRAVSTDEANAIIEWVNGVETKAGSGSQGLLIPHVIGYPVARAELLLSRSGFGKVEVIGTLKGRGEIGEVLSQSPPPGSLTGPQRAIQLTIKVESRPVPLLIGKQLEQALEILEKYKLEPGRIIRKVTGNNRPGTVTGQYPGVRQPVAVGTPINLEVEADTIGSPHLSGMMLKQAERQLRKLGLSLGTVEEKITGSYPTGAILDQSPAPGRRLAPGTKIDLIVEAESVIVPQLIGKSSRDARHLLSNAGLNWGSSHSTFSPDKVSGTILQQTPLAGTRVRSGTPVSVTLAESGTLVPNLIGMREDQAIRSLSQSGLNAGRVRFVDRGKGKPGTVISQKPLPGTRIQMKSTVDLAIIKPAEVHDQVVPTPGIRKPADLVIVPGTVRPIQYCTVPDLFGRTDKEAAVLLKNSGLVAEFQKINGNRVLRQVPAAGEKMGCGGSVSVVLDIIY